MKRILLGALLLVCAGQYVEAVDTVDVSVGTELQALSDQQKIQYLQEQLIAYLQKDLNKNQQKEKNLTFAQQSNKAFIESFKKMAKKTAALGSHGIKSFAGGAFGALSTVAGYVVVGYCLYRFALPLALDKFSLKILELAKIDAKQLDPDNLPNLGFMDKFWGVIHEKFFPAS